MFSNFASLDMHLLHLLDFKKINYLWFYIQHAVVYLLTNTVTKQRQTQQILLQIYK
jgi:hypothetical protein